MTIKTRQMDFSILREDFPILKQTNRARPLIYLDSAATAQKPKQVVEAMTNFYYQNYANVHRGVYELSERATQLYELAREEVKEFIRAKRTEEIVFVKGTTEGINLVAHSFVRDQLQAGDEILISTLEHHSNIVPWYFLKEQLGIQLKIVPITYEGVIDIDAYRKMFTDKTKFVALSHTSNALGTINPAKELVAIAHEHQVPILLDGAQAIPHMAVNVKDLDCDFYVFSAHKIYGPSGLGVLYAKKEHLNQMEPYQGGGDMIESVSFEKITFAPPPQKFEAGTPPIAEVIGLSAALRYVSAIRMENIYQHEQELLQYAEEKLTSIPGLKLIGTAKPKVGVISFIMEHIHPHDLGTVLDHEGIAIRAGHHCAMPLMNFYQIPATARASFGVYTQKSDIDALVQGIELAKRLFV